MSTTGTAAITLAALTVAAIAKDGITQSASVAVTLGRVSPSVSVMPNYSGPLGTVECMTGLIRATGGAIFQFQGIPNAAVTWTITVGSGSLTAQSGYTDGRGGRSQTIRQAGTKAR